MPHLNFIHCEWIESDFRVMVVMFSFLSTQWNSRTDSCDGVTVAQSLKASRDIWNSNLRERAKTWTFLQISMSSYRHQRTGTALARLKSGPSVSNNTTNALIRKHTVVHSCKQHTLTKYTHTLTQQAHTSTHSQETPTSHTLPDDSSTCIPLNYSK